MQSSQETHPSASSSSSSVLPSSSHKQISLPSISPIQNPHRKRSPRTEGHPNATKNIKNSPNNSSASKIRIITKIDESKRSSLSLVRRSLSTMDFRKLDQQNYI